MCYSFLFINKFLLPCLLVCKPLRNMLYLITPSPVAFQFNQEPSRLPRYRHLAFSRFISIRQTTHESKTSSGLKDSDIIHKILEHATPFFPLFHQLGTPIWNTGHYKPSKNPWDGEFLYIITSYRMPKTIWNTTWRNLCPNLASAHDSLKNRNPIKKYFLFHENPIPAKNF